MAGVAGGVVAKKQTKCVTKGNDRRYKDRALSRTAWNHCHHGHHCRSPLSPLNQCTSAITVTTTAAITTVCALTAEPAIVAEPLPPLSHGPLPSAVIAEPLPLLVIEHCHYCHLSHPSLSVTAKPGSTGMITAKPKQTPLSSLNHLLVIEPTDTAIAGSTAITVEPLPPLS